MNKIRTSERLNGARAFTLSALFHIAVAALIFFLIKNCQPEPRPFNSAMLNLSFAQIELQAAAEPPLEVSPAPVPEEIKPEPVLPEPADVEIDPMPEEPKHEPEPAGVSAQVTQEASAPAVPSVARNVLLNWVREQIEKEKYYPSAARNAGYEGTFRLLVKIGTDGKVLEASVLDGKGHFLLRRSLEKIMDGLIGRSFGQILPAPVELPFEFEFKLQ